MTDESSTKRAVRKFSPEFKRQVVEQSLAGHATVVAVARAHAISRSMIWRWRSEYKANNLATPAVSFLPVGIATPSDVDLAVEPKSEAPTSASYLELHLGSARLVIHGRPDLQVVKGVIEVLR